MEIYIAPLHKWGCGLSQFWSILLVDVVNLSVVTIISGHDQSKVAAAQNLYTISCVYYLLCPRLSSHENGYANSTQ